MLPESRRLPEEKSKRQQHLLNNHRIPKAIHHVILSNGQCLIVFGQVLSPVISSAYEKMQSSESCNRVLCCSGQQPTGYAIGKDASHILEEHTS